MLKNRKANKIACINCFVSHLCMGRYVGKNELEILNSSITNVIEIKKGEHAFLMQDELKAIYAVYTGSCKQYFLNTAGVEHIENFYLAGDLIGLESIPNKVHRYSLMALEDTQLCIIPVSELINQMQQSSDIAMRILNICSYKMQNDKQISSSTNATQRVSDFLLNIYHRIEERRLNKDLITLPMSQLDISNFLGMAHETVNRVLRKLNKEKIISIKNKIIQILDIPRLKEMGSLENFTGQN